MSITAPSPARLDAILRFEADIEAAYERSTGACRVSELRRSIAVGLVVYNVYNLTSIFLLPDILEGRIEPGRVFDRTAKLDEVPDGYRAMDARESIKVLIEV